MVLQAEVYSGPGFGAQQNYSQESSYKDASYYGNNSSSMQMMRPNPGFSGPNNSGMNGYGAGGYGGGGYGPNNGMNRPSAYYGGGGPGNGSMYPQHGGYGNGGYGNGGYGNGHHGSTHMMPMGSTNRMEESRYQYQGSSGGPFGHQMNQNSWVSKDLDD